VLLKLSWGDGTVTTLSRLLGTGGEAFIHEIQEVSKLVAKIYRHPNAETVTKVLKLLQRTQ
jgi:DNA-binding helix-hairpin-helix protein with protein kinase domain